MKKVVIGLMLGALGMFAWQRAMQPAPVPAAEAVELSEADDGAVTESTPAAPEVERQSFTCDGRQYCSQMTSCEEAMYFLENCPNVKMDGERDGEGDGIPCERQWCGHLR